MTDCGDNGIRIDGDVPENLGPCVAATNSGGPPPVVFPVDPVIASSRISGNVSAGIRIQYPHIPTQVLDNEITDNGEGGVLLVRGDGFSLGRGQGPGGCYFSSATVVLPLADDTRVTGNRFGANGEHDLISRHVEGTLDASGNCWDPNLIEPAACSVGSCDTAPPPQGCD